MWTAKSLSDDLQDEGPESQYEYDQRMEEERDREEFDANFGRLIVNFTLYVAIPGAISAACLRLAWTSFADATHLTNIFLIWLKHFFI